DKASIIYTATPKLARSINSKYIKMGGVDVVKDFQENHGLKLDLKRPFMQGLNLFQMIMCLNH
ncbi:MAG: hypothetical protein U9N49_04140, partial [Campylobacterota bacterium]|nr:hypothetical protein [Campylobacterota bacterium]